MHPYSSSENRVPVYIVIAVLSVLLAWAVNVVTELLDWPGWLFGGPSVALFYTLMYWGFREWGWRSELAARLRLSQMRNISGTYRGFLKSTWKDEHDNPIEKSCTLEIYQSWTDVSIKLTVADQASSSASVAAALTAQPAGVLVHYYYRNEVKPGIADEDMSDHDGSASFEWRERDRTISGRYFNMRPNKGSLTFSPD